MQLLNRLFKIKKLNKRHHKKSKDNNNTTDSVSSTSSSSSSSTTATNHKTHNNRRSLKRFSSLRHWRSAPKETNNSSQPSEQAEKEQQALLTQCIETALYVNHPNSQTTHNNHSHNNKRWSHGDATPKSISFFEQEPPLSRQRKLSLPPQLNNIGYLASIPEVDSQVTLDVYK